MPRLALYADAAAQAGVTDAAEILYELIEPWADQVAWNGADRIGHARMYLGLLAAALGRDEQADEHFALRVEIQERRDCWRGRRRAHLGWAEALAARGEPERAREQAARARARSHARIRLVRGARRRDSRGRVPGRLRAPYKVRQLEEATVLRSLR